MSVSNSYSPVSVLQLHRESHINDVIVICSAVIFAGVVVVGLAEVLRSEGEIVQKFPFMMLYDADYSPIIDSGPIL